MKKEIRFSAKLDTQEFDKTVDALQRKLKEIYKGSDQNRLAFQNQERLGRIGMGPGVTPADKNRMDQADSKSRRETDQFIKQQIRDQEKLAKSINSQVEEMKKLQKLQKDLAKDSEEYLKNNQKLSELEKRNAMDREMMRAKDVAISGALDQKESLGTGGVGRIRQAYRGGGVGGAMRAGGRMMGQLPLSTILSASGSALGGLGALLGIGSNVYREYGNLPGENLASRAGQTGAYSQTAQNMMQGRAFQETFAAADRAKAMQLARQQAQVNRRADTTGMIGGGLGIAGGALGIAAGTIGTGGLLPLAAGIGAAGYGAYKMLGDEKARAKAFSYLPGEVGKRYGERYENMISDKQAQDFSRNFENQKQLNSLKYSLVESVGGQRQQNQAIQRALGIGDEGLYGPGGFVGKGLSQGFTRETMEQNSQAILGAGGSTRMARGADYAARYSRDYGLTNAGQLLGQISGRTGSATEANSSLMKIMKESVKAGFDSSEFAAENRKFVETATQVALAAGATTDMGFQRGAGLLGDFTQNRTMSGIQAGQSALQLQTELTSSATGPRAAIQAANMFQNPTLSKLGREQKSYLLSMSRAQLTPDSPEIMAMAEQAGVTPEELVKAADQAKTGSTFTRAKYDKAGDRMKSMIEKRGFKSMEEAMKDTEFVKEMGLATTTVFGGELSAKQKELTPEAQRSFVAGQYGLFGKRPEDIEKLQRPETLADKQEKGQAAADQEFLNMFRQMKPEMDAAASATGEYAKTMVEATKMLQQAMETMDPDKIKQAQQKFFVTTGQNIAVPTTQTQTNSPAGGK